MCNRALRYLAAVIFCSGLVGFAGPGHSQFACTDKSGPRECYEAGVAQVGTALAEFRNAQVDLNRKIEQLQGQIATLNNEKRSANIRLNTIESELRTDQGKKYEFILKRSPPANPAAGARIGCNEANGESLVAGSCIGGLGANGEGGGQAAVGPFLLDRGFLWDVGNPIYTVECRGYNGQGATALAVCLRVAK